MPSPTSPRQAIRRTAVLAVLIAALAVPLAVPVAAAAATPTPLPVGKVLLQAHRGGSALGAPENSAAVFRLAVASGIVDRIETDIRITSDKVLVLSHDQVLPARCTNTGSKIHLLTWAELQAVRCDGEPIPALTELFDIVTSTPVALNLELKIYDGMTTTAKTELARLVVAAVKGSGLAPGQVMLSSWYWRSYAGVVQKYGKGIFFSAIELASRAQPTDAIFSTIRKAKALGVDAFAGPMANSNEGLLAFARDYGGMNVGLMDTTSADLRFALAQGLRNVTNDDPVATRASLDALLADLKLHPLTLTLTPTGVPTRTVLSKSLAKYARTYPQVIGSGKALPVTAAKQLRAVVFTVTVKGKGHGTLELAPSGSRVGVDGVRVKIPNGTRTLTLRTVPGDGGDVRVRVTGAAKVVVKVTGYERAGY